MIRYRSLRMAPGANRPWLIESDEDNQPLSDFWAATADCAGGVRRLTTPIGPEAAGIVGWTLTPIVSASSDAAPAPHAGQNRAPSGSGARQPAQVTTGF